MTTFRANQDRGKAHFGWLDSRHSFSFGSYYDPKHMGISTLRVINDDVVEPGAGFDTHGHRDMEILSYVLEGTIEHKDSMGHIERIPAGDFQIMSAGTGVTHSEYNASQKERLRFLQVWLLPNEMNVKPEYDQKAFEPKPGLTAIVHPTANGAMRAHTDAAVYRYQGSDTVAVSDTDQTFYLHAIKGEINVGDHTLTAGDGLTLTENSFTLSGSLGSEALVFELP